MTDRLVTDYLNVIDRLTAERDAAVQEAGKLREALGEIEAALRDNAATLDALFADAEPGDIPDGLALAALTIARRTTRALAALSAADQDER